MAAWFSLAKEMLWCFGIAGAVFVFVAATAIACIMAVFVGVGIASALAMLACRAIRAAAELGDKAASAVLRECLGTASAVPGAAGSERRALVALRSAIRYVLVVVFVLMLVLALSSFSFIVFHPIALVSIMMSPFVAQPLWSSRRRLRWFVIVGWICVFRLLVGDGAGVVRPVAEGSLVVFTAFMHMWASGTFTAADVPTPAEPGTPTAELETPTAGPEIATPADPREPISAEGSPVAQAMTDAAESILPDVRKSELPLDHVEPLGQGATSTVYRTRWRGVDCAAKLYHRQALRSRAAMRELAMAPVLRHPSIVAVVARIVADPPAASSANPTRADPVIVGVLMELLEGGDLADACCADRHDGAPAAAASWSVPAKLRVCKSVAIAVAFAHGCRVVHSDIKHENVLLSKELADDRAAAEVKLADFGSAKLLNTLKQTAMTGGLGSPAFMCPVFEESGKATSASDVFSLGMLMWLVFHPESEGTLQAVARRLRNGKFPAIDGTKVPAGVAALIEQCWCAEPGDRPTADDVVVELERLHRQHDNDDGDVAATLSPSSSPSGGDTHGGLWVRVRCREAVGRYLAGLGAAWRRSSSPLLTLADVAPGSPFADFVRSQMRKSAGMNVRRIVAVQHSLAPVFLQLHEADAMSAASNPLLLPDIPADRFGDRAAALASLERFYADDTAAGGGGESRIVFAWHGGRKDRLEAICRDGVRPLGTTDARFFGAGSYFAFEAEYAAKYARTASSSINTVGSANSEGGNADEGERGVALFAVSVTRVRPVTLADYHPPSFRCKPHCKGFSRFYSGDKGNPCALSPEGCDAHFVPVKDYGYTHPRDPTGTLLLDHKVHYQACPAAAAEYHELVIQSHLRATPVAIVYFSTQLR